MGSFLGSLSEKLAWEDPGLRTLADYFVLSRVVGLGAGIPRVWPISILSEQLAKELREREHGTWMPWDEWNFSFSYSEWSSHPLIKGIRDETAKWQRSRFRDRDRNGPSHIT